MNRREWMMLSSAAVSLRRGFGQGQQPPSAAAADSTEKLLLKDYRPVSIYKIPKTEIPKAKYPIVDVHCHGARPVEQLDEMVKVMDGVGVEKAVIFTGASTAERFTEIRQIYSRYPKRFDLWCGFDLTGSDQPGFGPNAVKALEETHRAGAMGVGEIT